MAKFVQALIGMGSGKLGSAILYKVAGTQLARSYVPNVNDKDSEAQRDVRYGKFLPAINFLSLIKYYDIDLYPTSPSGRTRYAQMMKDVFPAFGGTEVSPTVNLALATIGNGGIPMQEFLTAVKGGDDQIDLTWDPTIIVPSQLATDKVYAIVTNSNNSVVAVVDSTKTRSDGSGHITVPPIMSGTVVTLSTIYYSAVAGGNETCSKVKIKQMTVDLS